MDRSKALSPRAYADFGSPDCNPARRHVGALATVAGAPSIASPPEDGQTDIRAGVAPSAAGDIADRGDVAALLRDFYGRAFADDLLGPVFVDIARMDLEEHLPVMCDFWQTVLFRAGTYRGNALHPHQRLHARARLSPAHFARWLTLWRASVDDRYAGPKAELAKVQASRIAGAMSRRITGRPLPAAVTGLARPAGRTDRGRDELP